MKKIFRNIVLVIAALVITTSIVPYQQVSAQLNEASFPGQDINYYSRKSVVCAPPANGDGTVIGGDVAEKIFKFFISTEISTNDSKVLNSIQAAAILGNFSKESTLDPSVENGIGAYGLAQWLDRRPALEQFAASKNKPISDLQVQLEFTVFELEGKESAVLQSGAFKEGTDIEAATVAFRKIYERPGEFEADDPTRISEAKRYFNEFKDLAPDPNANVAVDNCTSGATGGLTDYDGDDFVLYNQCDAPWGSMTNNGGATACAEICGPASLAMVVKNMTGQDITPAETAQYYIDQGWWTSAHPGTMDYRLRPAGEHWGLRTETMTSTFDVAEYKKVLDAGGLIIIAGRGDTATTPFYPQGHFIVIRGMTPDGKFIIGDPGLKERNNQTWDANVVVNNTYATGTAFYKQ